jgi:hemoglobin
MESRPRAIPRRQFLKAGSGIVVFGGLFVLVGCGDDDDDAGSAPGSALKTAIVREGANAPTATPIPRAQSGTLYERVGGRPAIQLAIDAFLPIVAFDARINAFFANADAARINKLLVEFIGELTGGPEKYSGRTMKEVHSPMGIQKVHFDALMEDLAKALDQQKVPEKEKAEIIALLNPLSKDIVTA